jgi:hypothetical protein
VVEARAKWQAREGKRLADAPAVESADEMRIQDQQATRPRISDATNQRTTRAVDHHGSAATPRPTKPLDRQAAPGVTKNAERYEVNVRRLVLDAPRPQRLLPFRDRLVANAALAWTWRSE